MFSWRKLFSSRNATHLSQKKQKPVRRHSTRLHVETLEERVVPAFSITGPGTAPFTITAQAAGESSTLNPAVVTDNNAATVTAIGLGALSTGAAGLAASGATYVPLGFGGSAGAWTENFALTNASTPGIFENTTAAGNQLTFNDTVGGVTSGNAAVATTNLIFIDDGGNLTGGNGLSATVGSVFSGNLPGIIDNAAALPIGTSTSLPARIFATGLPTGWLITNSAATNSTLTISSQTAVALPAGNYPMTVSLVDANGNTWTDSFTITVAGNAPISANIGTVGHIFSATLPMYDTTSLAAATITNSSLPVGWSTTVSGTGPVYTLTVTSNSAPTSAVSFTDNITITDSLGHSFTDTFTIVINPAVQMTPGNGGSGTYALPVAEVGQSYVNTGTYVIDVSGGGGPPLASLTDTLNSNGGNGTLTQPANFPVTNTAAGSFVTVTLPAAALTTAGTIQFTVNATDAAGYMTTQVYAILVDSTVSVTSSTGSNALFGTVGRALSKTITVTGGSGSYSSILVQNFNAGGTGLSAPTLSGNILNITGTPTGTGTATFSVQVTDTNNYTFTPVSFSITIEPALSISLGGTAEPSGSVLPAGTYSTTQPTLYGQTLQVAGGTNSTNTGEAPAYQSLTVQVSPSGSDGLTLAPNLNNGQIVISGYPSNAGTVSFSVTVVDGAGATLTDNYTIPIEFKPLFTTSATLPSGTVNRPYAQNIAVSGGDGVFNFTLIGGSVPAGLSLNLGNDTGNTMSISGTPTLAVTNQTFTLQAVDTAGIIATQTFTITINPVVTTANVSETGTVGQAITPYNVASNFSGGTAPYALSTSSLPAGLTYANGIISGTPSTPGNTIVVVTETDNNGDTASFSDTISISPAITFVTSSLPSWTSGLANYANNTETIAVTGGLAPYTYSATGLPTGLNINSSTGLIFGTPTAAGNSFNVNVTVTDSNGASASRSFFPLVIAPPVNITTQTLPSWTVDETGYSATVTATGGSGTLQFSLSAGSTLPAGLTMSPSGLISGTPTATTPASGYSFTVTATDQNGAASSATFSIAVNSTLTVSPNPLTGGTAGNFYSRVITVSGGTTPYTSLSATVTSANTVTGISFTANLAAGTITISGTPTSIGATGTLAFDVSATDSSGATLTSSSPSARFAVPFLSGPVSQLIVHTGVIGGSAVTSVAAGAVLPFYVTAEDQYGNIENNPAYNHEISFSLGTADSNALFSTSSTPTTSNTNTTYTFTGSENPYSQKQFYAIFGKAVANQQILVNDVNATSTTQGVANFAVTAATAHTLNLNIISGLTTNTMTAGGVLEFSITAKDQYGNIATNYAATTTLSMATADTGALFSLNAAPTAGNALPFSQYSFSGNGTGVVTLYALLAKAASNQMIDITDGSLSTASNGFTVVAGSLSQLVVKPTSQTVAAGAVLPFSVTAADAYGNPVGTAYTDGVSFTLGQADTGALFSTTPAFTSILGGSPPTYTFTAANNGTVQLYAKFTTVTATQTIIATDIVNNAVTPGNSGNIDVTAAALNKLVFLTQPTAGTTNGTTGTNGAPDVYAGTVMTFVVAAEDAYGNVTPSYGANATLTLSALDPSYSIYSSPPTGGTTGNPAPITYQFTPADAGLHTFYAVLGKANTQTANINSALTINVNDSSLSVKSNPFNIVADASVGKLAISPLTTTVTAGTVLQFTVTAEDSYGNVVPNGTYLDTIEFTLGDATDTLAQFSTSSAVTAGSFTNPLSGTPPTFQFTGSSTVTLWAIFTEASTTQSIIAQDTTTPVITGTSPTINVQGAAATQLVFLTQPAAGANINAGTAIPFTVAAEDQYGNTTKNYGNLVHLSFSTSDPSYNFYTSLANVGVTAATTYTFTAADAGVHTFYAVLGKANTGLTVTVNDSSLSVTSNAFNIVALSTVSKLSTAIVSGLNVLNQVGAGMPLTFTVTAEDQYGNTVAGADNDNIQFTIGDTTEPFALFATDPSFVNTLGPAGSSPTYSFNNAVNGVLTLYVEFSHVSGSQSIKATDVTTPGVTAGTSVTFSVIAAGASQAQFATSPPSSVQVGTAFSFSVQVQDFAGNDVGAGNTVQVTFDNTNNISPGNPYLFFSNANPSVDLTTTATTNAAGIATFSISNYNVSQVDLPYYTVQIIGLNGSSNYAGPTQTFSVTGVASSLLINYPTGGSYSETAGTSFPVQVQVMDANGVAVATPTPVPITLTLPTGVLAAGSLSGSSNSAGEANYTLTIDKSSSTGFTLGAHTSVGSISAALPVLIYVNSSTAKNIGFSPTSVLDANAGSFTETLTVTDTYGNPVMGDTVYLQTTDGVTIPSSTPPVVTDSNGQAAFVDPLTTDQAGSYTMQATDGSLVKTAKLTITTGPAVDLDVEPVSGFFINGLGDEQAAVGTLLSFTVAAQDAAGETVSNPAYLNQVAFSLQSGSTAQFSTSPTTTTNASGQTRLVSPITSYKFNGMELGMKTFYAVLSTATAFDTGTDNYDATEAINVTDTTAPLTVAPGGISLAVSAGNVSKLSTVIVSGLSTINGVANSIGVGNVLTFTVSALDSYGNIVSNYPDSVSFSLSSNDPLLQFSQSNSTVTNAGITSFVSPITGYTFQPGVDLGMQTFYAVLGKVGNNLTIKVADTSTTGVAAGVSSPFNVAAGSIYSFVVTTALPAPPASLAQASNPFSITVRAEDAYGNAVAAPAGDTVSLTLNGGAVFATAGNGITGAGTSTVTSPVFAAVNNGIFTFTGLSIATGGTYNFTASDAVTGNSTSSAFFNITGPAASLVFTTEPPASVVSGATMSPVVVQLEDINGFYVQQAGVKITLQILNAAGGVVGTVSAVTNAAGMATFKTIKVSAVGTMFSLSASTTSGLMGFSSDFTVLANHSIWG